MTERQKSIISGLANSSLWDSFKDEVLREYIQRTHDVTDDVGNSQLFDMMKHNLAAAYTGRVIAGALLEDLIRLIEGYKDVVSKKEDYT